MRLHQKILLEVYMPTEKCRKMARKITALTGGFLSMGIDTEKNQLEITGVGIDLAGLVNSLRKKVGCTSIISVEEVKEEKKEEKKDDKKKRWDVPWRYNHVYNCPPPPYPGYEVRYGVSCLPDWCSW